MKILNGKELAGYIKERHARQVRVMAGQGIRPKLAIVQVKDDPVINTYVKLKSNYGADISVAVDIRRIDQSEIAAVLTGLNDDKTVHGIIVQLPLADPAATEDVIRLIKPSKDVDALGPESSFEPATPMAIMWLIAGYNIDLTGKKILLIGRGRLVGAPLERIMQSSGYDVEVVEREIGDLAEKTQRADVIITATGSPAIIYPDMIKPSAVVIDAGVASEEGKTVGDLAPAVYERDDLTITPEKGGVGPLTVCALFENVIIAASGQN